MNRITNKDLDAAFERYTRALNSLGITKFEHTLQLVHGSKAMGNSFKVVWAHNESGGQSGAIGVESGHGFIGWTKREAFDTMHLLARTLEDVWFFQVENGTIRN